MAAASPNARHVDTAPFDDRTIHRTQSVIKAWRQERRVSSPVAQELRAQASEQRMAGYPRKDLPQTVLCNSESEPLFQRLRTLLEHDHFQPVPHAAHVWG